MDLAAQILQAKDLVNKPVEIKEWGVTLYIKCFSGRERIEWDLSKAKFIEQLGEAKYDEVWRAYFIARCLVDENGARIFSDDQAEGLLDKNHLVIERLLFQCLQYTGYVAPAEAEAEKNSESEAS